MKVYIQSKSGDYNSTQHVHNVDTLQEAMCQLRGDGGYYQGDKDNLKELFVAFSQIEYIKQEFVGIEAVDE